MNIFDGKKVRDEILEDLEEKIKRLKKKPVLAVVWIGENSVSEHYVKTKLKIAESIGIKVNLIRLDTNVNRSDVIGGIESLNRDPNITGIMVQLPIPDHLDQDKIIRTIDPKKDVDGLRYCLGIDSDFMPPVVLAILKAIEVSGRRLDSSDVSIIGHGFLVGAPLARYLATRAESLSVADSRTRDLSEISCKGDILISATGFPGVIKPDMLQAGTVLIDAGTAEVSGEIRGDVDPACYEKASFVTPVPGGIGPVTIAMLLKNLVDKD